MYGELDRYKTLRQLIKEVAKNAKKSLTAHKLQDLDAIVLLPNQALIGFDYVNSRVFYNRNIKELLGYSEINLNLLIEAIHPKHKEKVLRVWKCALHLEAQVEELDYDPWFQMTFRFKSKSGDYKYLHRHFGVCEVDEQGFMHKSYSILTDLTELVPGQHVGWSTNADETKAQYFEDFIESSDGVHLTHRQKEIISHLDHGLKSFEIAEKLQISKNTVDTHRRNLIQLFEVKNTRELLYKIKQQAMI